MSVITEWEDVNDGPYSKRRCQDDRCAFSGRPLKLPFMVWRGLVKDDDTPYEIFINAESVAYLREDRSPSPDGKDSNELSFLHDLIELMHLARAPQMKRRPV